MAIRTQWSDSVVHGAVKLVGWQEHQLDRTKRLREEPQKGHNRWHPDIPPVIEVEPGEDVTLETRDAMDLQIGPRTTAKDLE
jgi:formamidase